ncbi:MAG TPA: hypothetical protein VNA25_27855 [Phycisphaerae bacterium]|nr:hypothetical protein [Phycisphaerae bacterium]
MGHRPGRKAEPAAQRPALLGVLGRLAGFALLAGPALAILAAVVLLPEYTGMLKDRYERDRVAAETADIEALRNAQERMVNAAREDVVFIKRLAMWYCNLWPSDEAVLDSPAQSGPPPGMVVTNPHPRPAPPDERLMGLASRLENPPTRRGLLLVAGGLMVAGMLLFGAAPRRAAPQRTAE